MSSRHRPYLAQKESMVEFWRNPARWMKDITARESTIEKPYLEDGSSPRKMNLRWPAIEPPGGGGSFTSSPSQPVEPPEPPESPEWPPPGTRTWTFIMDEGYCDIGPVGNFDCGDNFTFNVGLSLVPLRMSSSFTTTFYASYTPANKMYISDPVATVPSYSHVFSGEIYDDVDSGAGSICAVASLHGKFLRALTIEIPILMNNFGPTDNPDLRNLENVTVLNKVTWSNIGYDCGCSDFEISCSCSADPMSWDPNSDDTMGRNDLAYLSVLDGCGPYTWSVSGTGFSFGDSVTTGKLNTLGSDDTACGIASITVIDSRGDIVTGEVLCTFGGWTAVDNCNSSNNGYSGPIQWYTTVVGKWRYRDEGFGCVLTSDCPLSYYSVSGIAPCPLPVSSSETSCESKRDCVTGKYKASLGCQVDRWDC